LVFPPDLSPVLVWNGKWQDLERGPEVQAKPTYVHFFKKLSVREGTHCTGPYQWAVKGG